MTLLGLPEIAKSVNFTPVFSPQRPNTGSPCSHANTPPLGSRWVWCQPLRGTWKYPQYSQQQLISQLQNFSRIDVLHRAIDQGDKYVRAPPSGGGTATPQYFTPHSIKNVVIPWVRALRSSFPDTKIIGRLGLNMLRYYKSGQGLDPSDPLLQRPFTSFPSQNDMSNPLCRSWMVNWAIRYWDALGVDGIWYDNLGSRTLLNQTDQYWDEVYCGIHAATGDAFLVCSNSKDSLRGMKDAVENNVIPTDVCPMSETVDWASVRKGALAAGDPLTTQLTLHLDYPSSMGSFAPIQQYKKPPSIPCLDLSQRETYMQYFAVDMISNGYAFEWPMLAGDPGYGYDSIADGLFPTLLSAVNGLP